MKNQIKLNGAEIQGSFSRLQFAEALIKQLPEDHDGRNTWLCNYGRSDEAQQLRANHPNAPEWVKETESAELRGRSNER